MKPAPELEPLIPTLDAVQRLIDEFENRGIIIGGVAVSLLGRPRLTADVDIVLLVSVDDLPRLIRAAEQEGFTPRIEGVENFARRNRVVLLKHDASGIDVDISLGALPLEVEAVQRSQMVRAGSLQVRVPTVEDLIILKAVAHRPKDGLDVETLVQANPKLDRERIEFWVRQFADVLEMPELWSDLADVLARNT